MIKNRRILYSDIFDTEMVAYYQQHIIDYVYDIIFKNNEEYFLSEQQKEFLIEIQNNDRVAAKSGKGIGKTSSVTFAILWFLSCFPNPKIVCTAPTFPTLKTALWPEIAKWLNVSLVKNLFEHTERKLYLIENPKNWFCEPRTAKDQSSAQGVHEDHMMVIMDEASGVKEDIFEAYDTTLTGKHNKFVLIGNPVRVSGPFYDAFNRFRHKWKTLTFNAENSPFVKKSQIEYYADKYGTHHDLYLINIKGEFPSGSPDAFIKLSDIHDAIERYDIVLPRGEIEIGLDVARFGDDLTVLYWRQGYKVYEPKILTKNSIPEAAQLVLDTVTEIRRQTGYDKKIKVKLDDTSLGGGVTDLLRLDREHNIEVIPINFGGKGNDIYQNEVSIMWGNLRDNIKFIGIPDDSHLIEELSARRWKLSPSGKILIEPKSEFKKEFKSSPDRADALILCFAKKENKDNIIKDFDSLDESLIKKNMNYTGEIKQSCVFYSKDLTTSIIYTSWDNYRLYVYDEYIGKESLVYIANNLHQHQPLDKIFGNDSMFSLKGDDLASKFRKFGLNIYESFLYNELSAIETLSNMVSQRKIIINQHCKKTIEQISNWRIEKNRTEMENTFGLCYALCYIVSDLKRKQTIQPMNTIFIPYSNQKSESLKNIQFNNNNEKINDWMI
jgi:phage terminase large subunit